MARANVVINLIQTDNDDTLFIVDLLKNTLDPKPGAVLTEKQVERLLADSRRNGATVNIVRGNRKI
jgi:hypothetical protein